MIFRQLQRLGEPGNRGKRTHEELVIAFGFFASGLVGLVEKYLAEVNAAQHVLVGDRHLVELDVRLGVLDISLHQGSALLNVLDQHLFPANGPFHQCRLLRCELVHL